MPDVLATECKICPIGSYCVGDHLQPDPCPPGFYCPPGTGYDWKPCPPGTFNRDFGLHNVSCKFFVFLHVYVVSIVVRNLFYILFLRFDCSMSAMFGRNVLSIL